jgi:predicted enzyme related to lactoylglutathione lyase
MRRVVSFEIPVEDIDRAKSFFSKTFGWESELQEGPWGRYPAVKTGSDSEEGIDGAFYLKANVPPENVSIVNFIETDSIDDDIAKIKSNGGEILFGKAVMKGLRYFAYFRDPSGNIMGLLERSENAGMAGDD